MCIIIIKLLKHSITSIEFLKSKAAFGMKDFYGRNEGNAKRRKGKRKCTVWNEGNVKPFPPECCR